jgi:hypothetical protein
LSRVAARRPDPDAALGVELERAALRALAGAYDDLNGTFFGRKLRRPVLELGDSTTRLGRWHRSHRSIELARTLLGEHGWGVVVEVLKHEMAHQYVDEVLGRRDESAHGPAFRQVCAERGIDARAAGAPDGGRSGAETRVLERVAKLLALAESANAHEAEAAMSAAQRLMLKYNVDSIKDPAGRAYAFRHIGEPTGRVGEAARILAVILGDHFFVETIWVPVWRAREAKRGSVLEVCGTPENVELAAYVYSFMLNAGERLWREHKRRHGIRNNAGRRTFVAGVMSGFRDKLDREKKRSESQGLVWVGDADLGRYFKQRHPHVRWTRHYGSARTEVWTHGREAGRRLVLHRGVKHGPSGPPRLLPSRRGE